MKDLIQINQTVIGADEVNSVNARELHEKLGSKQEFANWIKRRLERFVENEDYISFDKTIKRENGATVRKEYILTIDTAKMIAMMENNTKGDEVRRYFIEVEKRFREDKPSYLIQDPIKRAEKWIEEQKVKIEAEKQRDKLIHQGKLYTTTEIAKELGFRSAIKFNKRLEDDRIQYKVNGTWVLTAEYANEGYTSIKQFETDSGKIIYDRKWTGTGRDFLLKRYNSKVLSEDLKK